LSDKSEGYENRQELEFFRWPELRDAFIPLAELVMTRPGRIGQQLRAELFTMASLAAGCQHCQAHGGFSLSLLGVDPDRIRDIWNFERSEAFAPAERAALQLACDAGSVPNQVGPGHFVALRRYYTDQQIREMLAVIALSGWYNRWNNTIATVTDQESVDWAQANLAEVGWSLGKHAGSAHEQRKAHPRSSDTDKVEY
jgi:alkylhydroperoxidase family enzyme